MQPKCGPNAARMWPEYEILWPVINPWTFPVARARPEPKPQARNPARTMKKVARPSPNPNAPNGEDKKTTPSSVTKNTEIRRFLESFNTSKKRKMI